MNHDITHCEGINCQARQTCYRYRAHLDLMKKKQRNAHHSYLYIDTDFGVIDCKQYILNPACCGCPSNDNHRCGDVTCEK